ncbi:MAG TPA: hypothetical protein PLZ43_08055 [bacterium]|nr:hypothetical protein [bacterium]
MAILIVTGKVEAVEDDKFLNVVVREDDDNVFRLAANSKNRDSIKVKAGDYVIVECLAKSKQNDKGYYRIDAWIHTIDNITARFVEDMKLAKAVNDDKKKDDDDLPPW